VGSRGMLEKKRGVKVSMINSKHQQPNDPEVKGSQRWNRSGRVREKHGVKKRTALQVPSHQIDQDGDLQPGCNVMA